MLSDPGEAGVVEQGGPVAGGGPGGAGVVLGAGTGGDHPYVFRPTYADDQKSDLYSGDKSPLLCLPGWTARCILYYGR